MEFHLRIAFVRVEPTFFVPTSYNQYTESLYIRILHYDADVSVSMYICIYDSYEVTFNLKPLRNPQGRI